MRENDIYNHLKKKKLIPEKSLMEKLSTKNNNYDNNQYEEINKIETIKLKKSKSSKKIYPLFRKIKILDSNSYEKDNKEGKYQFLHQKLVVENVSSSQNCKHKNIEASDSIDNCFDTTINTTDIVLHLILYNIQKYR